MDFLFSVHTTPANLTERNNHENSGVGGGKSRDYSDVIVFSKSFRTRAHENVRRAFSDFSGLKSVFVTD